MLSLQGPTLKENVKLFYCSQSMLEPLSLPNMATSILTNGMVSLLTIVI